MVMIYMIIYMVSLIPITQVTGYNVGTIEWDNGNIGFVWISMIVIPLIDMVSGYECRNLEYMVMYWILFSGIIIGFSIGNLILFFMIYEMMIIGLFIVILLFIPSSYRIRTSYYLVVFSLIGSIGLMIGLISLLFSDLNFSALFLFLPFYIKLPMFPFFYWLPEVHAESSTSASLYLAGLLLKIGLFGIFRFILCSFFIGLGMVIGLVFMLSLIGMLISSFSCYRLFDLKKIIAYCSILHLNLGVSSLVTFSSIGLGSCILTSISHGLSSIGLFLFVGWIINRSFTRFVDSLFFMSFSSRLLVLGLMLASLNFPGFYSFIAEVFSIISIMGLSIVFSVLFVISSVINAIFWFIIYNRKLSTSLAYSLSLFESLLISSLLSLMLFMGLRSLFLL